MFQESCIDKSYQKCNVPNSISNVSADDLEVFLRLNQTKTDYPKEQTIHRLFEEQVGRTPDAIALAFNEKTISYRELNEKADNLASYLQTKSVGPDSIVALMVSRSIDMIVGLLGILKAGGAYLPVDPDYPPERIKYMIEDSHAQVLLLNMDDKIDFKGEVIRIDQPFNSLKGKEIRPKSLSNSRNLAYVIYTSGSTGKPKGVMIEHRSVVNLNTAFTEILSLKNMKNILGLTTISFDIFVLETFLPLFNGMTIVIADEEHQKNLNLLSELIVKSNIEIIQMTPSRLKMLSNQLACLKNVKEIVIGGEAFPEKLLALLKSNTTAKIFNVYGPTETTVWSTFSDLTGKSEVDIGKPIANTQISILDETNSPVPFGEEGELCISGDGLSRGYLNNPVLTNERFINHPFNLNEKIYKTGDLAKWLPDGSLECIGRKDNQVKIRGHRIELGEIEENLSAGGLVKEAVVIANSDQGDDKYLAAFVITDKEVTVSQYREFLLKKLPDFMIPSYFIPIDQFPLTPNGKTDRKALRDNIALKQALQPGTTDTVKTEEPASPELKVIELLLATLKNPGLSNTQVNIAEPLVNMGINSMTIVDLVVSAEECFNIEILPEFLVLDNTYNLDRLIQFVKSKI